MKNKLKWRRWAAGFWTAGPYAVMTLPDGGWAWRRAPLTCWNASLNVHAAKDACERDNRNQILTPVARSSGSRRN